ncbi:MAG: hypothetical protein WKF66_07425 [Pedobacter sp.]
MLHQFTWLQFLIAALIFVLIWYLAIILLFYRDKIAELFSGKSKSQQPEKLRREWEEDFEYDEPENDDDLMGRKVFPDGESEVSMHMLGFVPKVNPDEKLAQLGVIPDVMEELKSIFHILEKENGTKEDFISLFALVSSKYPNLSNTSNLENLNNFIRENLPFELTEEELKKLWS